MGWHSPSSRKVAAVLREAADYLRRTGSSSPRLDAELLLVAVLGGGRSELYTKFDRVLTDDELLRFERLLERRAAHEPVAYILGRTYFRRLELEITPDVLIPRPETEELVEYALALLRRRPVWGTEAQIIGQVGTPLVADVGTGSGAIALSLAQEAKVRVLATDTDPRALSLARRNAVRVGVSELVEFVQADLLAGIPDCSLHLVVSNPPYVRSTELSSLMPDVRLYEPLPALDGGDDGLEVIRCLLLTAARALRPGGSLLLEVGDDQASVVVDMAHESGFALVCVHKDLSGKERVIEATKPGTYAISIDGVQELTIRLLQGALAEGAVIGLPTDTVCGLAARWDSREGVSRLFAAKGRPATLPVAVLFPSVKAIRDSLPDLHPSATAVLEALLPGPYTFVVETHVSRPENVGTADSLGVRVPDLPDLLDLLDKVGVPLAATSANLSGRLDCENLEDVDPQVLAHCSLALVRPGVRGRSGQQEITPGPKVPGISTEPAQNMELTPLHKARPSTVVDLRPLAHGGSPMVLREGAVPADVVLQIIGRLSSS